MPPTESNSTELIRSLKGPIAIFGASGFIGANLLQAIRAVRSDFVGIVQNPNAAWRLRLLRVAQENLFTCDIADRTAVEALFAAKCPQTIFNLAAYGSYSRQIDSESIYRTNVLGALHILEAAKSISAYVHSGTSYEYGFNCRSPNENAALRPNSHYAVSKVASSFLIQYMGGVLSVPAVNLRLYSVYGPWEEPDRLIPRLIEEARSGSLPPLVNPGTTRDFVYIDDCVEALIRAAARMTQGLFGEAINIGTGVKTTLDGLVTLARELLKVSKEPVWGTMENRKWDTEEWFGNFEKAESLLSWRPTTTVRRGLELTAEWQERIGYGDTVLPAFKAAESAP